MQSQAVHIPLSERINFRLIAFSVVVLALVGYPVYIYLESVITGGIKDVGGGVKQVDLKAMSTFPFNQNEGTEQEIPQQWRELDGKRVILYGELWAPNSSSGRVSTVDLCYSIAKCCFSGPPQVQHFVRLRPVQGKSLEFYPNLVKVTGTLHVKVLHDGGDPKVSSVYQLDVDDVQPAT
jgi:hypothetical protein